jgi:hypothetical protein
MTWESSWLTKAVSSFADLALRYYLSKTHIVKVARTGDAIAGFTVYVSKYFAWGWWTTMASVLCSGTSM